MSGRLTALAVASALLAAACGSSAGSNSTGGGNSSSSGAGDHGNSGSGNSGGSAGDDAGNGGSSGTGSSGSSGAGPGSSSGADSSGGSGASSSSGSGASGDAGAVTPALFYLDLTGGRVMRAGTDGTNVEAIVTSGNAQPDGVVVDVPNGYVYWTNMGAIEGLTQPNDGFIRRANIDGSNATTLIPEGNTHTPKQMKLDATHAQLYWCDREGMRVMRANTDGSNIETLVTTGTTDNQADYAVGIALDLAGGEMYWTQKGSGPTSSNGTGGQGSIRRAGMQIPAGQNSTNRTDIDVLFSGLPEPIDMDVDLGTRQMYWTDRGDGTVSRAPMDPPAGFNPATRTDRDILLQGLGQVIGIYLDVPNGVMYYTGLDTGAVSVAPLDGSSTKNVLTSQGGLAGITLALLPK
ncbi:MAG: 3-hydroxyacyl-CoA dehydrogenase [Polyangiaceae bacterium]